MKDFRPVTEYGKKAREIAQKDLALIAQEVDQKGIYDPRALDILIAEDLIAPTIPKVYGGLGIKEVEYQEIMEEISKTNTSASSMITNQLMSANAILNGGSEEQKQKYLHSMAKGKIIGTLAITESHAGSDVAAIEAAAERLHDVYVLNGKKELISFLGVANIYIVFAKTDP